MKEWMDGWMDGDLVFIIKLRREFNNKFKVR